MSVNNKYMRYEQAPEQNTFNSVLGVSLYSDEEVTWNYTYRDGKRIINGFSIDKKYNLLRDTIINTINENQPKMKDISVIPKGDYCYSDNNTKCPYWSMLEDLPEQENGYCSFLEKSDFDLNEEKGSATWKNKDGEDVMVTQPHEFPLSLLWDQCKECGLNYYTEAEEKLIYNP